MGVPQWLAQNLIDAGHWDVNGLGRNARGRRCRDCGDWVIAGWDADRCAGTAHIDPTPLTALGEAMALIDGRSTYMLRRHEGRTLRLDHRHRWAIASKPAGHPDQRGDIVAEHRCHAPDPTGPLVTESVLRTDRQEIDHEQAPPY